MDKSQIGQFSGFPTLALGAHTRRFQPPLWIWIWIRSSCGRILSIYQRPLLALRLIMTIPSRWNRSTHPSVQTKKSSRHSSSNARFIPVMIPSAAFPGLGQTVVFSHLRRRHFPLDVCISAFRADTVGRVSAMQADDGDWRSGRGIPVFPTSR